MEIVGAALFGLFIITIYLSTAVSIVLSAIVGVLWLVTAQFKKLPAVFGNSQVNLWALLLFLLFIIGLTYGNTSSEEANAILRKYRELIFIPLFSCFFNNERYRRWAWAAFVIGSLLTLASSYLMELKLVEMNRHRTFTVKSRITHSIFIAFFLFYCLHKCLDSPNMRLWFITLFVIGVHNLYFVTNGRTGQLILVLLIPIFALQRLNKKQIILAFAILPLLLALYLQFSDKSSRINVGLETVKTYIDPTYKHNAKDTDLRISFWRSSVKLIKEKPWFGHGTGSFGREFQRITQDKLTNLQNPHNEYLMMTVQFGLCGFLIYLGFLYSHYRDCKKFADTYKWLAQGLLLTLMVTSMFNSPFLDHAEGHWFAVMIALCLHPDLRKKADPSSVSGYSQILG